MTPPPHAPPAACASVAQPLEALARGWLRGAPSLLACPIHTLLASLAFPLLLRDFVYVRPLVLTITNLAFVPGRCAREVAAAPEQGELYCEVRRAVDGWVGGLRVGGGREGGR